MYYNPMPASSTRNVNTITSQSDHQQVRPTNPFNATAAMFYADQTNLPFAELCSGNKNHATQINPFDASQDGQNGKHVDAHDMAFV